MNSRFNLPFIGPSGDFQEDARRFIWANVDNPAVNDTELADQALRYAASNMVAAARRRFNTATQGAQNVTYLLTHTSDPKRDVQVNTSDMDAFILINGLNREELMKVLRGEQRQHKGWSVSPRAYPGSGYSGVHYREAPQPEPDPDETPQASKKRLFNLAAKRKAEQQATEPRTKTRFNPNTPKGE